MRAALIMLPLICRPFRFRDNVVDRVPALQHALTRNPAFDGDSVLLQEAVRRWQYTAAALHMCSDLSAYCVSAPLVVVHNPSCRYALWVCALPDIVHDAFPRLLPPARSVCPVPRKAAALALIRTLD